MAQDEEKGSSSIETTKAVCGPAMSPNKKVKQNTNEGQPQVGELFFIHQEADNVSLSSMSSDPTAYTETEIVENRRDYPLSVNYALSITASSANSSVSSVTHNGIAKFKSRSILTALRRKPLVDHASGDKDALPGYVPKTWSKDPAVNTSTDPTIDLENRPSQEESSYGISADEESVLSKGDSSTSSFSDGFGGYIYQNCIELNPRTTKLFILTASMLLLFGVSAVVAAIIVDGNPVKSDAGYKQLTSLYDSPVVISSAGEALETAAAVDPTSTTTAPSTSTVPSTAPTSKYASNDEPLELEWIMADDTTTSEATALTVDPSTTDATTFSSVTSSSTTSTSTTTSSTTMSPSTTSSSTVTSSSTTSTSTTTSSTTMSPSTTSSSAVASSSTTSTSTTTTTPTTTMPPSTTSPPSKLSATYIQAIANSFLVEGKAGKDDNKNAKADKEDADENNNKDKDKGQDDVTIVRFDILPMLNDPRGTPFKVFMRPGSTNEGFEEISLDYLPKAGLWDCSPCERANISSDNSVAVGTFDKNGFVDVIPAFSKGIFDNQMTFRLNSSEMLPAPELVLLWVEGSIDDFAGLSTASLMEMVSEDEDLFH